MRSRRLLLATQAAPAAEKSAEQLEENLADQKFQTSHPFSAPFFRTMPASPRLSTGRLVRRYSCAGQAAFRGAPTAAAPTAVGRRRWTPPSRTRRRDEGRGTGNRRPRGRDREDEDEAAVRARAGACLPQGVPPTRAVTAFLIIHTTHDHTAQKRENKTTKQQRTATLAYIRVPRPKEGRGEATTTRSRKETRSFIRFSRGRGGGGKGSPPVAATATATGDDGFLRGQ